MGPRMKRKCLQFHKFTIILIICLYYLVIELGAEIIVSNQGLFSNPSIFSLYKPTNLQRKNLQNIFNQQQSHSNNNNNQFRSEINNKNEQQLKTQIINKAISNFPNQRIIKSQLPDTYEGLTLFNLANTVFNPSQNNQRGNHQQNFKTQTVPILSEDIKNNSPFNFFNDQTQVNTPLIEYKSQTLGSNKMMDKIDLTDFENELNKAKKQVDYKIFDVPSIQSSTNSDNLNIFSRAQFPQNKIRQNDYSFPNIANRPAQYNNVLSGLEKSLNERFNNFFPV